MSSKKKGTGGTKKTGNKPKSNKDTTKPAEVIPEIPQKEVKELESQWPLCRGCLDIKKVQKAGSDCHICRRRMKDLFKHV